MRKALVTALCFFSLFAIFASDAQARKQLSIDTIVSDRFEEQGTLRFYVDIQDASGNVPTVLKAEDIQIAINGEPTEGVFDVTSNKELGEGTAVMLMIPAHGSFVARDGIQGLRQIVSGARSFVASLGPQDYIAIRFYTESGMTDYYTFTQEFGGAESFLERALNSFITRLEGNEGSDKGDRDPRLLRKFLRDVLKRDFNLPTLPRRKVVLLFTAGHDDTISTNRNIDKASGTIIKEANKEAEYRNNTRVKIHVVGISGFGRDNGLSTFNKIAEQTGGTHFQPIFGNDFQELADAFETMGDRILRQHVIHWTTEDWDGGEATIRLTLVMSGTEQWDEMMDIWPERPSNWVGTFFTIFFTLLGIVVFILLVKMIAARRKNEPVVEEEYGDESLGARAVLLAVGGPHQGEEIFLADEVTTFGRSDACEVQLDDPTMSRRHAAIRIDSMRFELSDIKSASGTFVNGRRIEKCFLKDGDLIMLGETKLSFKLL